MDLSFDDMDQNDSLCMNDYYQLSSDDGVIDDCSDDYLTSTESDSQSHGLHFNV